MLWNSIHDSIGKCLLVWLHIPTFYWTNSSVPILYLFGPALGPSAQGIRFRYLGEFVCPLRITSLHKPLGFHTLETFHYHRVPLLRVNPYCRTLSFTDMDHQRDVFPDRFCFLVPLLLHNPSTSPILWSSPFEKSSTDVSLFICHNHRWNSVKRIR